MTFDYLSKVEIAHLKEIKDALSSSPSEYFFHRFQHVQELKQTTKTMGMWQWHYMSSMFYSLIESFKAMGKMLYSLVTLHFSVAGEQVSYAAKMALSALAKLTLSVSLFCLQLTRFITLAMTALFTQIGLFGSTSITDVKMQPQPSTESEASVISSTFSSVRTFFSSIFQSSSTSAKANNAALVADITEFKNLLSQINEEKTSIQNALNSLYDKLEKFQESSPNKQQRFFSNDASSSNQNINEKTEEAEILKQLWLLLKTYPAFDINLMFESAYIKQKYTDFSEHQAQVLTVAEEFFKRMEYMQETPSIFASQKTQIALACKTEDSSVAAMKGTLSSPSKHEEEPSLPSNYGPQARL